MKVLHGKRQVHSMHGKVLHNNKISRDSMTFPKYETAMRPGNIIKH